MTNPNNDLNLNDFFTDPQLEGPCFYKQPSTEAFIDYLQAPGMELELADVWFGQSFEQIPQSDLHTIPYELLAQDQPTAKPKQVNKTKRICRHKPHHPHNLQAKSYSKNICRNILRKAIRCLDSDIYNSEKQQFCSEAGCSVQ